MKKTPKKDEISTAPETPEANWEEVVKTSHQGMLNKVVPAILEFAATVKLFHDYCCETKQGGSAFARNMRLWLHMSQSSADRWLRIGECDQLTHATGKLPPAYSTIYELALLPPAKLEASLDNGRISPSMTRLEARAIRGPYAKDPAPSSGEPVPPSTLFWRKSLRLDHIMVGETPENKRVHLRAVQAFIDGDYPLAEKIQVDRVQELRAAEEKLNAAAKKAAEKESKS